MVPWKTRRRGARAGDRIFDPSAVCGHSAQFEEKMSRLFQAASAAAVAATALVAIAMTVPGLAQTSPDVAPGDVIFESSPIVQPLDVAAFPAEEALISDGPSAVRPATLSAMVREMAADSADNAEQRCLAIGVFYEARAESLEGQLAVAHVILNRAHSGRFASSVCGVLTQPHQFSFVRGGVLPTPAHSSQWRTSVGVARVAMTGAMASPVPGALFFHATHVSPGWNRPRIARLGNHVFYR
ncbi:MAG: cell wall hydrolase [Sphingopyxis sp.]